MTEHRLVLDRENEMLYITITHEGVIVDSLPHGQEDVQEVGAWEWHDLKEDEFGNVPTYQCY